MSDSESFWTARYAAVGAATDELVQTRIAEGTADAEITDDVLVWKEANTGDQGAALRNGTPSVATTLEEDLAARDTSMNQYWYSDATLQAMVAAVAALDPASAAHVSCPTTFFVDMQECAHRRSLLLEYDTRFKQKAEEAGGGFVFYDFNDGQVLAAVLALSRTFLLSLSLWLSVCARACVRVARSLSLSLSVSLALCLSPLHTHTATFLFSRNVLMIVHLSNTLARTNSRDTTFARTRTRT